MQIKELQESLHDIKANQTTMLANNMRRANIDDQFENMNAQTTPLRIQVFGPEHPSPPGGETNYVNNQSPTAYPDVEEPTHSQVVRFYNPSVYLSPTPISPPMSPAHKKRDRTSVSLSEELVQMLKITGAPEIEIGTIETPSVRSFKEQTASSSDSLGPNEVIVRGDRINE